MGWGSEGQTVMWRVVPLLARWVLYQWNMKRWNANNAPAVLILPGFDGFCYYA